MKAAALISGGKDSLYAVHICRKQGIDVAHLVAVISENPESYMWHYPNAELTKCQAEALGIPIVYVKTKGEKEKELDELKNGIKKLMVDAVITGAVASNYQKERIEKLCSELKLKHLSPLWGRNQEELVHEMIDSGMEIIITAVAADGLTKEWLGKLIDKKTVDELKKLNVSVVGEGGEFETFVLFMPGFNKRLKVKQSKEHWKEDSGFLEIKELEAV